MSTVSAFIRYFLQWALSLIGFYTIWISSAQNGFFAAIAEATAQGALPGSPHAPLRTHFTGIYPLDCGLELFVIFYWPVGNGNLLPLSLLAISLSTLLGVTYILVILEASQRQPLSQAIGSSALVGVLLMLIGPAITLPIYCALNLASDNRRHYATPEVRAHSSIQYLPVCLLSGYYFIVFIIGLPSPAGVSDYFKQGLIVVLQGWPLWVSSLFWLTVRAAHDRDQATRARGSRSAVYMFALCAATIPYLAIVIITQLPDSYCRICDEDMTAARIFLPNAPWSIETVSSLEEGLLQFFKWDFALGSIAILLWAIALEDNISPRQTNIFWVLGKAMVLSVFLSPCGAAVVLLWQLDRHLTRVKAD